VKNAGSPLPLSLDEIEAFRYAARLVGPAALGGAHLRRRNGQSLEFREFRQYQYGDDVRLVDWRTSARFGGSGDWVVRLFEAEERFTLAVSVDCRPSMYLPASPGFSGEFSRASKIQLASWLIEVFSVIAEQEGDDVVLHHLFAPSPAAEGPERASSAEDAQAFCAGLRASAPQTERQWAARPVLQGDSLLAALPPASVLVILSDLYFMEEVDAFVDLVREAQQSYRQVVLVRLDSWPLERALLESGVARLQGLEGVEFDGNLTTVDVGYLDRTLRAIERHAEDVIERCQAGGLEADVWPWPSTVRRPDLQLRERFADQLFAFEPLTRLFAARAA